MSTIFHLAFPVHNLAETKTFYIGGLGCSAGRETPSSIILSLHGHQLVAHVTQSLLSPQGSIYPRHFGLIFDQESEWESLLERSQHHHLKFYQEAKRRFPNTVLEHRTFFLEDPFHNLLEFKFYLHPEAIFGAQDHQKIGDA